MTSKHAYLSASGAHRWIECPGSAGLCASLPPQPFVSQYAEEGSRAHRLAEKLLTTEDMFPDCDYEMLGYITNYVTYVRHQRELLNGTLEIEKRVHFEKWVPEGWGTADVVIANDEEISIIDLKYGKGVGVNAENNPQLRLYMLGAYESCKQRDGIKRVSGTIVQPRLDHTSTETLTVEELLEYGSWIKQRANDALSENPTFNPGESQCRFCIAKAVCRARAEKNMSIAKKEFRNSPDKLSTAEISAYLKEATEIKNWVNDLYDYALNKALEGEEIEGFRLSKGRSYRKWKSNAADVLTQYGYDEQVFERRLKNLTEIEKILGKGSDILEECVIKVTGRRSLVPESASESSTITNAVNDFND